MTWEERLRHIRKSFLMFKLINQQTVLPRKAVDHLRLQAFKNRLQRSGAIPLQLILHGLARASGRSFPALLSLIKATTQAVT